MRHGLSILTVLSLLLLSPKAYATNYCNDANIGGGWQLNESSGNAIDCSSNSNDLTPNNTPTQGASGKYDTAYTFASASSEYLESSTSAAGSSIGTSSYVGWFKGDSAFGKIVGVARNTVSNHYCGIYSTGVGSIICREPNFYNCAGSTTINGGSAWFHLAGLVHATNSREIYVDGSSEASSGTGCTGIVNTGTTGLNRTSIARLSRSSPTDYLNGSVDDAAIFTDVLTSTEINDMMDNGLDGAGGATVRRIIIVKDYLEELDYLMRKGYFNLKDEDREMTVMVLELEDKARRFGN